MPNFARVRQLRPGAASHASDCPVRLRDASGHVWIGYAQQDRGQVRYRFSDPRGAVITGVANGGRIVLTDDKGVVWQGSLPG
jgi:hypothetical protein